MGATVNSYLGGIGIGNTFNSNYLGTSTKVNFTGNDKAFDPAMAPNLHGDIGGFGATGFNRAGTGDRIAVSDSSTSTVSAGGFQVGNQYIAYDGSYVAPLVGHTTTDDFTNTFYTFIDPTTYNTYTVNTGTAANRNNSTIFNSSTFAKTGNIVWNQGASSYTDISSGTATDVRDSNCTYTRFLQLAYRDGSGNLVNLTNGYSDMSTLNSSVDVNTLIKGLLPTPGSVVFGTYYLDHIQTSGGYDYNFDYDVASNFYAYRYTWQRFDPTKILYEIGASGLLNLKFDQASKDQYTLTDLQTGQSAVYEEVDELTMSGVKGNFKDKDGNALTSAGMGNTLAKGDAIEFYGLGRIKNPSAGGVTTNIDYVVFNKDIFSRLSNNFVRSFTYNGNLLSSKLEEEGTKTSKYLGTGSNEGLLEKGMYLVDNDILQTNKTNLITTNKDLTIGKGDNRRLYYNDTWVTLDDNEYNNSNKRPAEIDLWNPYLGISSSYNSALATTFNYGLTKLTHNYLIGIDGTLGVKDNKEPTGSIKTSGSYRYLANGKICSAIGIATEFFGEKNPYDKNAFYWNTGYLLTNYFYPLDRFSFGIDLSNVSSTGLNKNSDLKDSVMQTWNALLTTKYRFKDSSFDLSLGYSGLNTYYKSTSVNYLNPGFSAEDHFADKFSARAALTYFNTAKKAYTFYINGNSIQYNAKDNGTEQEYLAGGKYMEPEFELDLNAGVNIKSGGIGKEETTPIFNMSFTKKF